MSQPIILVTSRSFSSGKKDLNSELVAAGYQVVIGDFSHDLSRLADILPQAVAWIAGVAEINESHLAAANKMKVIARYGVGYEAIDLAAAKARGIIVTNTPGANSLSVAEHSLALLFASARNLSSSYQNVLANNWKVVRGSQIAGSKIGVVGFGKIGRLVVKKLIALEADVLVSDPFVDDAEVINFEAKKVELTEIRDTCQFVLLQAPGGQQIINKAWVEAGKSGQVIINTARADLVDEAAIAHGLNAGSLNFYAADALQDEVHSPLLAQDLREKVLITAHIAAQTDQAIDQMGEMAVLNVLSVLSGSAAVNPVL